MNKGSCSFKAPRWAVCYAILYVWTDDFWIGFPKAILNMIRIVSFVQLVCYGYGYICL